MDHAIVQVMTPCPGTEAREQPLAEGLVTNSDDCFPVGGLRGTLSASTYRW